MSVPNYNSAAAVTPSDSENLANSGMLYISGTGNVKVTTKGGQDVTILTVPVGLLEGLEVERVWSTGTTATGIHVFY